MRREYYTEKKEVSIALLKKLKNHSKAYLIGKLISFILAVLFFYYYSGAWDTKWGLAALASFGFYLVLLVLDSKLQKKVNLEENKISSYQNELAYYDRNFSEFDSGEEFVDPKHSYSFDLDLFGKDSFFQRINRTVTRLGKARLAKLLGTINLDIQTVVERKEAVKELAALPEWRTLFIAYGINSTYDLDKLAKGLVEKTDKSRMSTGLVKAGMICSIVITITSILLAVYGMVPGSLAITLFLLQIVIAVVLSGKINAVSNEVGGMFKGFREYKSIIQLIDNAHFVSKELTDLQKELKAGEGADKAFTELASILNRLQQRANFVVFIVFNGLVLHDLWVYRSFLKWKERHAPYVERWIEVLTHFDALTSLATYSFNHPENGEATFIESESPVFCGTNLYHPFLKKEVAVANDFTLSSGGFAIVTGANMAGKSTFLRSVGINYVMAMNGLPVCADSLELVPVKLFSSMRTSDNLAENISYFNAELNRLEQLISFCKSSDHTLIILDEILKGTNSVDKLNGSKLFLNEVSKLEVSGIIATHDLDLAKLEEEDDKYINYSFEIELGEEIDYSYKIGRGVAQNLNATFLLEKIIAKIN